ncbi:hypothetical protein D6D26_01549 [Aureobasidium pullulans]|nr:hypothetical protein D6D26_01549 [Aureobasidium pullulans]
MDYLAVLWEDGMHNILAIVCSKRVTAPCSMLVCSDYIGNLAGRVNSASNTGFVYKHVKYLIGTLFATSKQKSEVENDPGPWDKEKKSYHHVGGISGHAQRTTEVAQRLYAKALYYTKYFGLDPKDFSQKNGILYFCEGS